MQLECHATDSKTSNGRGLGQDVRLDDLYVGNKSFRALWDRFYWAQNEFHEAMDSVKTPNRYVSSFDNFIRERDAVRAFLAQRALPSPV